MSRARRWSMTLRAIGNPRLVRKNLYAERSVVRVLSYRGISAPRLPRSVFCASRICRGERGLGPPHRYLRSPHVMAPPFRPDRIPLPGGQGMTQVHPWRAFAALAVLFFMTVADLAIVNVALPTIGRKLHMPESALHWVVTGYALTFGGFLLLGGRAADLLGPRRILMAGLAGFPPRPPGCRRGTPGGVLIPMRCLQGLGAARALPAALSIVMNMFPEGAERNKALGVWGAIGASGATVGLIAGGLLTRYAGWQDIFFLNVPIGAAALLLAPRVLPAS